MVSFAYYPVHYTNLHTNNNSSYSYSSTVQDTVQFSLTYLYCKSGGVLATRRSRFSAVLQDPATVQLAWSAVNEIAGSQYQVQRSQDGQHFTTITSLGAMSSGGQDGPGAGGIRGGGMADYAYNDNLPAGAAGKEYYRLPRGDPPGLAYSARKQVTVAGHTRGPRASVYSHIHPLF